SILLYQANKHCPVNYFYFTPELKLYQDNQPHEDLEEAVGACLLPLYYYEISQDIPLPLLRRCTISSFITYTLLFRIQTCRYYFDRHELREMRFSIQAGVNTVSALKKTRA